MRCAGAPAPRRLWRSPRTVLLALFSALAAGSCMDARSGDERAANPSWKLAGSADTLDELGAYILEALATADTQALAAVRLSEHEHNRIVWPELPASRPEVNFPLDYAWANIEMRNESSLARILPMFETLHPMFERVECRGSAESFRTFEVLTDCWVIFADAGSEDLLEMQIFKDVLARGTGYKVFRYYDEQPRLYRGRTATGRARPPTFSPPTVTRS